MILFITADSDWESGVGKALDDIDQLKYEEFFVNKKYGESVDGITVVFMCQSSDLRLKQRVRFIKKEKHLYLDIMLNLDNFIISKQEERKAKMIEGLVLEIPRIIKKYRFSDFDVIRFEKDLRKCFLK